MLRERYEPDKFFESIVALLPEMEPVLAKIDGYLEDDEIIQLVKTDLAKRHRLTVVTGRPSTPVEVVMRMLVVKQLYGYSYEETERYVSDSLALRKFCRVYLNSVPDDTVLLRQANLIQPQTLEKLNARITQMAQQARVTKGHKLRTDGTVVECNIHRPSDNQQLADSVRVLARTIERAKTTCGSVVQAIGETFENLTRTAKQKSRQIGETLRKRTDTAKEAGQQAYRELIQMTQQTVEYAKQILKHLDQQVHPKLQRLAATLRTFIPRAEQVMEQTERRIFRKENVPAQEKLVSIFEDHTDIIMRGKDDHPVEYGHKVWLDEVDGGIISHYRILDGNPSDCEQWVPSLDAHIRQFGQAPQQASADRGVYSADNEQAAKQRGVEYVILPKPGYRSEQRTQYEHQDWFVTGRKWHAGVEGRISVLKRAHLLALCLNHGLPGFQRWVGWSVIAGNLAVIGRAG
jgi:IS5 family transposase